MTTADLAELEAWRLDRDLSYRALAETITRLAGPIAEPTVRRVLQGQRKRKGGRERTAYKLTRYLDTVVRPARGRKRSSV